MEAQINGWQITRTLKSEEMGELHFVKTNRLYKLAHADSHRASYLFRPTSVNRYGEVGITPYRQDGTQALGRTAMRLATWVPLSDLIDTEYTVS